MADYQIVSSGGDNQQGQAQMRLVSWFQRNRRSNEIKAGHALTKNSPRRFDRSQAARYQNVRNGGEPP